MNLDIQTICCQITEFFGLFHQNNSNKQSLTENFFNDLLENIKININDIFPQLLSSKMRIITHLLQFLEQKPFRETIKTSLSFILR
jgi:hypothetical protein